MGGLGCLEALSAGLGEEVPEPGSLLKSSPPPWGAGVSSTGLASAGIHVWGCSSCCGLLLWLPSVSPPGSIKHLHQH